MRRKDLDVDLRRLRRSAALAGIGDGVIAVALPLLTASVTRDPLDVASVFAAQHVPWLLVALLRTRLGARIDRRTTVGLGDTVRAVALGYLGLQALVGEQTLFLLQLVAFAVGIGEALTDDAEGTATADLPSGPKASAPSTRTAVTGMAALALIGLPIGGFLYEVLAAVPPLVDVLPFAFAALFALSLRRRIVPAVPASPEPSRPTLLPGTGPVILAAAVVSALSSAVLGVLVLFALDDLGLGAPAFGALLAGLAVAGGIGGLLAPEVGHLLGLRTTATLALLAAGGGVAGASLVADPVSPYPAVLALAVATGSAAIAVVILRALLHSRAGRTVPIAGLDPLHVAVWGAIPLGALAGGAIASSTGVADLYLYLGAATAAVGVAAAALRPSPRPADNRLTPVGAPWSDAKERRATPGTSTPEGGVIR